MFLFGKKNQELENLIYARDKATDLEKRSASANLDQYMKRHNVSEKQYWNVWYGMYSRMAATGDPFAMGQLGELEFLIKNNPKEGLRWLTAAADAGNTHAMVQLSDAYCKSNNEPGMSYYPLRLGYNPQLCYQWLMKAANAGDPDAIYQVAINYFLGDDGFSASKQEAREWAEYGANLNLPRSLAFLADIEPNVPEKMSLYGKAINGGNEKAFLASARGLYRIFSGKNDPAGTHEFVNPRRAAQCFLLEWFLDSTAGDEELNELSTIPYNVSEVEWNQWQNDAFMLVYR